MSDKPSHWDWLTETRAIRDSRPEPPEPGSPSAELAGELGGHRGGDPMNDRADEAAQWCERIMLDERRERLLAQYYSTDDVWLPNRLRGVVDDCLSWNSTDRPLFCHTRLGHRFDGPGYGRYGKDFGTVLDLSEPVFNLGGAVLGVMASHPMVPTVFTSTLTPLDPLGWMKFDKQSLHKTCDWRIAKNCENRRRFVLAWPLGNWIVYYVTCSPCAKGLTNRI